MNKKYITQISALLLSASVTATVSYPEISIVKAADYQKIGSVENYEYELWDMHYVGKINFNPEDSPLSAEWGNNENTLFRIKRNFNSEFNWSRYGDISVKYDITYKGDPGNQSDYIEIYGWFVNPNAEFYVIEAWANTSPPETNTPLETVKLETVKIDGVLYDIYRPTKIDMGGIHGTSSHYIFWSVRRENQIDESLSCHISGTVSLSKHMEVWAKYGLSIDDGDSRLYDAGVMVDGYRDVSVNATINSFEITTQYTPQKPPEPDFIKGDSDNNGIINISDLLIMREYIFGVSVFNEKSVPASDMDSNGKIDILDFILLKEHILFG